MSSGSEVADPKDQPATRAGAGSALPVFASDVPVTWDGQEQKLLEDIEWRKRSPYPGLRAFRQSESGLFFGRTRQSREIREFFFSDRLTASSGASPTEIDEKLFGARGITFVMGGSGSGKSSIVKAGLLSRLAYDARDFVDGNWYFMEFRPRTKPADEMIKAVVDGLFISQLLDTSGAPLSGPETLIGHIYQALGVSVSEELNEKLGRFGNMDPLEGDTAAARHRAWFELQYALKNDLKSHIEKLAFRRALTGEGETSVPDFGNFLQFVNTTLDSYDDIAAGGRAEGDPKVVIYIDQFEEIFRREVEATERSALFDFLRAMHATRPRNIFVIATMRSEELHRCSEFPGLATVLNDSMYLLDLIDEADIRDTICNPLRQKLLDVMEADDSPAWPFSTEAINLLQASYGAVGRSLRHTADQLPLLQHFLFQLWLQRSDAWGGILRASDAGAMPAQNLRPIGADDLKQVQVDLALHAENACTRLHFSNRKPSSELDLAFILDATATIALANAVSAWVEAASGTLPARFHNRNIAIRILRSAFCNLAQLDSQDRVVRRWQTLAELAKYSGALAPLKPESREWRNALACLEAAFKPFIKEVLIERIEERDAKGEKIVSYTVFHEALIRRWSEYAGWVERAKAATMALVDVDEELRSQKLSFISNLAGILSIWGSPLVSADESNQFSEHFAEGIGIFSPEWGKEILIAEDERRRAGAV